MNKKLLIHHHAPIYISEDGRAFVQSFIGAWVEALAVHFDQVGLIMSVSSYKTEKHDFEITSQKVKLHLLLENLGAKNRRKRYKNIRNVCSHIQSEYDYALIRGITPKQYIVYKSLNKIKKGFLLVGSLVDSNPKWKWDFQSIYSVLMWQIRKIEFRSISKHADLFANSPRLIEEIKNITKKEARYFPTNILSSSHFNKSKGEINPNDIKLLFVGRVVEDKGIYELVKAFIELREKQPVFSLDIVGTYDLATQIKIENIITHKHKSYLSLHGHIPYGYKLFEFYQRSDIFILPSYHEGFPKALWEATAFELPIITTPVGGIPGLVSDRHVFYTPKKDVVGIKTQIEKIIANKTERHSKVKEMRKLALENTVESATAKFAEAINE